MARKKRDARLLYVGGYVGAERKRKLQALAERRQQSMSEVLAALIDKGTANMKFDAPEAHIAA